MLLKIDSLRVHYGNVQALHGIDLHVQKGEIVTILGANGAGKSTTLMTVSGLLKPSGGSVYFQDRELNRMQAHKIVEMGVTQVPEGRRVFGTLSVQENLDLGAFTLKAQDALYKNQEWIFTLFPRLKERRKQLAGTLSGGEQQMLAIARALMASPDLLLLDEPSLGLAPILVKSIFSTIKSINESGVTILLVEQNARAALKLANRAYVMEVGRVVLEDDAAALLKNPEVGKAYLGG
ncbi:MAG: ABC transporter ATP-binding protein [Thermodesulfobacteriota bacterium]